MAQDLSSVIAGIRSSYEKTNMKDIKLEEVLAGKPEVKVGYLLQNMPSESSKQYAINFDPVENLFLDKLVNQEVVDKRIIMTAKDFFRGIVFLDYFCTIICNDTVVLDELLSVSKVLERKDPDLDPDLPLVVKYAGIFHHTNNARSLRADNQDRNSVQRYRRKNKKYEPEYVVARKISPIYEALGAKVCELAKNETIKQQLPEILSLYDLKAALFVDAVVENISNEQSKTEILAKVQEKDYYKASFFAMKKLEEEVAGKTVNFYIDELVTQRPRQ
jgi:hypothetical protein